MRKAAFFLLSLLGSLSVVELQARPVRYHERFDYDGSFLNYGALLNYATQKLEPFLERIEQVAQEDGHQVVTAATDDEAADIVISYGTFLIALLRMRQEAACIDGDEADMAPTAIWYSMGGIFSMFPKELQQEALNEVAEFIQEHGQDPWKPAEQHELYKPSDQWASLRMQAADAFNSFLQDLAQELA